VGWNRRALRLTLANFLGEHPDRIVGHLQTAYAQDGYRSQIVEQSLAWADVIPVLQSVLQEVTLFRGSR
jgi:hypothetical protein